MLLGSQYVSDLIQSLLHISSTLILDLCKHIFQTLQTYKSHLGEYVVTPTVVEEGFESLQWFPHWVPYSITCALEFLTPPYKGHHQVMVYVLRVMETQLLCAPTCMGPQL